MKMCQVEFAYFVLWKQEGMFIEKINIDREFIDDVIDKTKPFIKMAILPELMGKWFTKQNVTDNEDETPHDQQPTADQEDEDRWCYCKKSELYGDMISVPYNGFISPV